MPKKAIGKVAINTAREAARKAVKKAAGATVRKAARISKKNAAAKANGTTD